MKPWRLILGDGGGLQPLRGAVNMAVDSALFDAVQRGAPPAVRFYLWQPACLSLGRNQPAIGIYDADAIAAAGYDLVRRPTGGLAVLHDAEVTYSVIAGVDEIGTPRDAYRRINVILTDMLRRLGVDAAPAAGAPADPAGDAQALRGVRAPPPCFDRPAQGEVVAAGRKLIGSAQRCERRVILQHGSILLAGSQTRINGLMRAAIGAAERDGGTALGDLLGTVPTPPEIVDAALAAFAGIGGIALAPGALHVAERERVRAWASMYRSPEWTWRR